VPLLRRARRGLCRPRDCTIGKRGEPSMSEFGLPGSTSVLDRPRRRRIAGGSTTGTAVRPDGRKQRRAGPPLPGGFLVLLVLVVVLNLIGLVMVLSASSVESIQLHGSPWYYFERQVLWLSLGAAAFLVTLRLDYRRWRQLGPLVVAGTIALLLAVLLPGFGI